ncbi:MAG: transglycosylase SLT domain-containing protein [Psychrobium sp.]|nr:transglycosylase SLT domain-containing protein [Psychrobium sp.]
MPGHDYKLLKAQCWQESRFNRYAISPVGAKGLCQFMPATWKEAQRYFKSEANAFSERHNIQAAAWYNSKMYRFWSSPRPISDRYNLMLASYNGGAGNIHKAQKRCGNPNLYQDIIKCLPLVTGRHSKETINYVQRINHYYEQLRW